MSRTSKVEGRWAGVWGKMRCGGGDELLGVVQDAAEGVDWIAALETRVAVEVLEGGSSGAGLRVSLVMAFRAKGVRGSMKREFFYSRLVVGTGSWAVLCPVKERRKRTNSRSCSDGSAPVAQALLACVEDVGEGDELC